MAPQKAFPGVVLKHLAVSGPWLPLGVAQYFSSVHILKTYVSSSSAIKNKKYLKFYVTFKLFLSMPGFKLI